MFLLLVLLLLRLLVLLSAIPAIVPLAAAVLPAAPAAAAAERGASLWGCGWLLILAKDSLRGRRMDIYHCFLIFY